MLSAVPWPIWLVVIGLFALPCSVIVPIVGLKLWEWFVERGVKSAPERKLLDTLDT